MKNGAQPADVLDQLKYKGREIAQYANETVVPFGGKMWHIAYDLGVKKWVAWIEDNGGIGASLGVIAWNGYEWVKNTGEKIFGGPHPPTNPNNPNNNPPPPINPPTPPTTPPNPNNPPVPPNIQPPNPINPPTPPTTPPNPNTPLTPPNVSPPNPVNSSLPPNHPIPPSVI
jgi:hypothetical protein